LKHPKTALLALILAITFWVVAETSKASQSPPIKILALAQPVGCGELDKYLVFLRKRFEIDLKLLSKGLFNPVFIEDQKELDYYEKMFYLVPCART